MLLLLVPLVTLAIGVSSFLNYQRSIDSLAEREQKKKDNIEEGVKLFIDNYDLSLALMERVLDERIEELSHSIISNYSGNWNDLDLDSVRSQLSMDSTREDLYIFNRDGEIINTTNSGDLGLDFYEFGESYQDFFKELWNTRELSIERVGLEAKTKIPVKYAYQAINSDYILEIGMKNESLDNIIEDFNLKLSNLSGRYSNIWAIDLFGATEAFPSRNKNSVIDEDLIPAAIACYKNQRDTLISRVEDGSSLSVSLIYLPIRNSNYLSGYVLQVKTVDSLEDELFRYELKRFLFSLLIMIIITAILLYFFSRRITQPLRYLVRKVQDISDGNVEELDVQGSAETAYLGREFNQMFTRIKDNQSNLELKVEERTLQLSTTNQELEKLSQERGLLIKEIHHRVKNNLQIVSSLLSLQTKSIKGKEAMEALENSQKRVEAMAILHEKLYKSSNFITINAYDYILDLVETTQEILPANVMIKVKPSSVEFTSSEAIAIGLITNEAIINSVKHAFDQGQNGIIEIEAIQVEQNIIVRVVNDGKKIDLDSIDSESLGYTIIEAFSENINGTFNYKNIESGVMLEVVFPKDDNIFN